MKRVSVPLSLVSLLVLISAAQAAGGGGVPKLDVAHSCREAQAFAGDNNKLAYQGCMQDENDALKTLQQNWSRFKPENRSTCLAQGLAPMPSYVEILTCIEMYDGAGMLRPAQSQPPAVSPAPAAPTTPAPDAK